VKLKKKNYYETVPQPLIDRALAAVNVDVWRMWDDFLLLNFDAIVKTIDPQFFHEHARQQSMQVMVDEGSVTKFITVWAWDVAPVVVVQHNISNDHQKIEWIVTTLNT
jgi:hypothetical protein